MTTQKEIQKTLKYMKSKHYKETIANAQKEFKTIKNRDVEFFNSGKECFRGYVLRTIDEKIDTIRKLGDKYSFNHDSIIRTLQEIQQELGK